MRSSVPALWCGSYKQPQNAGSLRGQGARLNWFGNDCRLRKKERKLCAASRSVADGNGPLQSLHDLVDNGQAQSRTVAASVASPEALEDFVRCSDGTPKPQSITSIEGRSVTCSRTDVPAGVCLIAFSTRLPSAARTAKVLVRMTTGLSLRTNSMPLPEARASGARLPAISAAASFKSTISSRLTAKGLQPRGEQKLRYDAAHVFYISAQQAGDVLFLQRIHIGHKHRERRAQLMRGIGIEFALPMQALFEMIESRVHRLDERKNFELAPDQPVAGYSRSLARLFQPAPISA